MLAFPEITCPTKRPAVEPAVSVTELLALTVVIVAPTTAAAAVVPRSKVLATVTSDRAVEELR